MQVRVLPPAPYATNKPLSLGRYDMSEMPLLEAAKAALDELIALQASYEDALGLPASTNGVAILLEDAIERAEARGIERLDSPPQT